MSGQELRANPYVGLRPFFADDSLYFFGREQQTAELLEILRQHRFLGVVGSSGSGKSSLVRAGLLPGLLGGFLVHDRDRWRTIQIKPGDAPIGNLAAGLLKAAGQTRSPEAVAQLEQAVRDGHTDAVIEFLTTRMGSNDNVFLLVDQFEEIFAFRGLEQEDGEQSVDLARRKERARRKAEAADFVDLLLALAGRRELPIYVALTMRTDFLGDCDLFYGLPEALNRGRYLVPRMSREQLRDAVECPALLLEASVAPRLMDHVLNELGDRFDRLPVLQHALLRTWDEWQRAGGSGPIDSRHFEAAGGLEGALNQDAEGALQGLDRGATERVFKRLTDTDLSQRRVRSPARISALMAAAGADRGTVEGIVRCFEENGRSFVHHSDDGKPDDPRVDISHESLIRQWTRLRSWVDEERQWRDEYRELVKKAGKWEQWKRDKAALLQNPELQLVVDWKKKAAPSPGWAARYSVADGDFESAAAYLDKSVDARFRNLAETELQRRWAKIWSPLILVIEFAVGVSFAKIMGLLQEIKGIAKPKVGAGWNEKFLNDLWDIFTSRDFVVISLFIGGCVLLNLCAKWVHRRFAFDRILQAFVSSDGRSPIEVKAKAREPKVGIDAQDVSYASTIRRVCGFLVDALLQLILTVAAFFVVTIYAKILDSVNVDRNPDALGFAFLVLVLVFSWLYSTLQIRSKRQATLGMRAAGIVRTDLHGERLSFARASAWFGCRFLSYAFYGLGFLIQPFTPKRQTLHDLLARTVVRRRRPPPAGAPGSAPPVLPTTSSGESAPAGGRRDSNAPAPEKVG